MRWLDGKEKVLSHLIKIQEVNRVLLAYSGFKKVMKDPGFLHVRLYCLWHASFLATALPLVAK